MPEIQTINTGILKITDAEVLNIVREWLRNQPNKFARFANAEHRFNHGHYQPGGSTFSSIDFVIGDRPPLGWETVK